MNALHPYINQIRDRIVPLTIIFMAYLISAQIGGYVYNELGTAPTILWPALGIAIAAVILEGYIALVPIVVATILNSFISDYPLLLAIGVALSNCLTAFLTVYLLHRINFDRKLSRPRDMFAFLGVSLLGTMIAASFNAGSIYLFNIVYGTSANTNWMSWWIGGALSVLILTSFIIRWFKRPFPRRTVREWIEIAASMAALILVSVFLFGTDYIVVGGISLIIVLFAVLFWISFRTGPRMTTLALFVMTVISILGALYGVYTPQEGGLPVRMFNTLVFDLFFAVFFFVLVSVEEQRKEAVRTMKHHADRLEDALYKINLEDQAKNEFIATLAHELRNPLALLRSSIELLKLEKRSEPGPVRIMEVMDDRVRMMARLLDDLLDISRITQQKFELKKTVVDLRDVILRSVADAAPMMNECNHSLTTRIPEGALLIEADATRVEQVLVNLLSNAAKYSDSRSNIVIECKREPGFLVVSVSDNGIGISADRLAYIFEPFAQIREGREATGGIGIGLSLSKKLVEMHDGEIFARSDGEGKGSEFIVRLPVSRELEIRAQNIPHSSVSSPLQDEAQKGAVLSPLSGVAVTAKGEKKIRTILVVDDNQLAAEGLGKLLEWHGYTVMLAYDGLKALDVAKEVNPDVVVLDIGLPKMNGYDVARTLKTSTDDCPYLIALSGYGQMEDKIKAKDAGFDHHLTKPVGIDEVAAVLNNIRTKMA